MKSEMLKKINHMIVIGMKLEDIATDITELYPNWTFENALFLVKVQKARLDGTYVVAE